MLARTTRPSSKIRADWGTNIPAPSARSLRVEIAPGYGLTGLESTYLIIPTGGCSRISARAGRSDADLRHHGRQAPHLTER